MCLYYSISYVYVYVHTVFPAILVCPPCVQYNIKTLTSVIYMDMLVLIQCELYIIITDIVWQHYLTEIRPEILKVLKSLWIKMSAKCCVCSIDLVLKRYNFPS